MWPAGFDVNRRHGGVALRIARAQGEERRVPVGEAELLIDGRPSVTGIEWPDERDALEVFRLQAEHDRDVDHAAVWLTDERREASARTDRLKTTATGVHGTIVLHRDADERIVGIELLSAVAQLSPMLLSALVQYGPDPSPKFPEPAMRMPMEPVPPDPKIARWNAPLDEWAERHRWQATFGSAGLVAAPVTCGLLWAGEPMGLSLIGGAAIVAMVVAIFLVLSRIEGRPVVPVPFRRGSDQI